MEGYTRARNRKREIYNQEGENIEVGRKVSKNCLKKSPRRRASVYLLRFRRGEGWNQILGASSGDQGPPSSSLISKRGR